MRRRGRRAGDVVEEAADSGADAALDGVDSALDTELVGSFGCCVVEAVGAASVLATLLLVPTYLLLS
jgi:hypothetical protein